MPTPYIGIDSRIAFGVESTWGTEVARTSPVQRLISTTLQTNAEFVPLPHLVGATSGQRVKGESVQVAERCGGDLVAVAAYEGGALGILLEHALGTVAESGAGPTYTHTWTVAQALPTGLSGVQQRGTDTVAEEFYGLKVKSLSLEVEAGGVMRLNYALVGKNSAARAAASPSLAALSTLYPILHQHAGTLSFNSANYTIRRFKLTIENKLDDQLQELGSLYISEPPIAEFADIMIEADLWARDNVLYAAHRAMTASAVALTFTDSTRSLAFTGHNAIIDQYKDEISGPGPVLQKVRFRPRSTSSLSGLAIALVNGITTGPLS